MKAQHKPIFTAEEMAQAPDATLAAPQHCQQRRAQQAARRGAAVSIHLTLCSPRSHSENASCQSQSPLAQAQGQAFHTRFQAAQSCEVNIDPFR